MKHILKPENYKRLSDFIGNPDQPFLFKSLYTAIVWSPDNKDIPLDQLTQHNIIIMNKDTPKFQDDYFFYRWLRTGSKTVFGSGEMVRNMDILTSMHFNFDGNDDMEQYSKNFGTSEIHKQKQFIISQSLTVKEMQELQQFKQDRFQMSVFRTNKMNEQELEEQDFLKFTQENQISMIPFQSTVRDAYLYTLQNSVRHPIMIDLGPKCVGEVLDLIEYLVLTVYRGSLSQEFIGGEMPKIGSILDLFSIFYESQEIPQHQGFIKVFVLIRKQ